MTLVHVSTAYVFDGSKEIYTEQDTPNPLGVYAKSKAAGDARVARLPKHYIIRTDSVIGDGKNFVRTMLELAKKGVSPTVVADQIGRLTFTDELVRAIDYLLTKKADFGTYNVTNDGPLVSWADITRQIFTLAGYTNLTVTNTTTAEYFAGKEGIAPRPLGSNMSLEKIHKTGFSSQNWLDELAEYVKKEVS
jgi:dTDP-4-dehydrorhamnose 3,5-epimerase